MYAPPQCEDSSDCVLWDECEQDDGRRLSLGGDGSDMYGDGSGMTLCFIDHELARSYLFDPSAAAGLSPTEALSFSAFGA